MEVSLVKQSYHEIIKSNGIKFTSQRAAILGVLQNCSRHLTIEDIAKQIKSESVSIATIYRTIKLYEKMGIVKEVSIERIRYYEIVPLASRSNQIHFKCATCNDIIDIENDQVSHAYAKMVRLIETVYQLDVAAGDLILTGICPKCQKEKDEAYECKNNNTN